MTSRWFAAGSLATAMCVLQVLAGSAIALLRHGDVTVALMGIKALEGALAVFGLTSVLVMFSSLAPGLGDVGVYLLAYIGGALLSSVGAARHLAWLERCGVEVQRFVDASLDPGPLLAGGAIPWFDVVSYLSTVTLCLVVAIWAVNRKELSYAAG